MTNFLRSTLIGAGIYIGFRIIGPVISENAKPVTDKLSQGCGGLRKRVEEKFGEDKGGIASEEAERSTVETIPVVSARRTERPGTAAVPAAGKKAPLKKTTARGGASHKGSKPSLKWSKSELYGKAKELKIDGRSKMNKKQLLEAVNAASTAG